MCVCERERYDVCVRGRFLLISLFSFHTKSPIRHWTSSLLRPPPSHRYHMCTHTHTLIHSRTHTSTHSHKNPFTQAPTHHLTLSLSLSLSLPPLTDMKASRQHAQVMFDGSSLYLTDLGSKRWGSMHTHTERERETHTHTLTCTQGVCCKWRSVGKSVPPPK